MPPVPVGQPSVGGGIAGIPTKWIVIGGGAAALGLFFLSNRKGTEAPADPNAPTYGAALGPNAALALGDLTNKIGRESGLLQEQLQGYFAGIGDSISGLSGQLDTQALALSDQYQNLTGQIDTGIGALTAGQQAAQATNQAQWGQFQNWFADLYRQSETTWRLLHTFHGAIDPYPNGVGYTGPATA